VTQQYPEVHFQGSVEDDVGETDNNIPSGFWIPNIRNVWQHNTVVNVAGAAFWVDLERKVRGISAELMMEENLSAFKDYKPSNQLPLEPAVFFQGNTAHSNARGLRVYSQWRIEGSVPPVLSDLRVFRNVRGITLKQVSGVAFENVISVENRGHNGICTKDCYNITVYGNSTRGISTTDCAACIENPECTDAGGMDSCLNCSSTDTANCGLGSSNDTTLFDEEENAAIPDPMCSRGVQSLTWLECLSLPKATCKKTTGCAYNKSDKICESEVGSSKHHFCCPANCESCVSCREERGGPRSRDQDCCVQELVNPLDCSIHGPPCVLRAPCENIKGSSLCLATKHCRWTGPNCVDEKVSLSWVQGRHCMKTGILKEAHGLSRDACREFCSSNPELYREHGGCCSYDYDGGICKLKDYLMREAIGSPEELMKIWSFYLGDNSSHLVQQYKLMEAEESDPSSSPNV